MLSFQSSENLLGTNLHVKVQRTWNKESFIVGYFLGDIQENFLFSRLLNHTTTALHEHLLGELLCAATVTLCVQSSGQIKWGQNLLPELWWHHPASSCDYVTLPAAVESRVFSVHPASSILIACFLVTTITSLDISVVVGVKAYYLVFFGAFSLKFLRHMTASFVNLNMHI